MPREVLFISPVLPQCTGGGLSMRAWHVLRAMARSHTVHLVVGSLVDPQVLAEADLPVASRMATPVLSTRALGWVVRHAVSVGLPAAWTHGRWPTDWPVYVDDAGAAVQRFLHGKTIHAIHVYRLYMMPLVESVHRCQPGVPVQLDMDDLEAETRERFAHVHTQRREWCQAKLAKDAARFYQAASERCIQGVDALWVCSSGDATTLRQRCGSTPVMVVPNTAPAPAAVAQHPDCQPFTFLFVGTLGYFPNQAGVDWLVSEVLPHLRRVAPAPFRVRVVGRVGVRQRLLWRIAAPELRCVGFADDLAREYAAAHAVVVPIHAGGGTRIKAIEAFAHRRPMVATSIGVEGLDALDGEHLLLADDAPTFADRCAQLMRDTGLSHSLADRAWELYQRRFHPDVMADAVLAATARLLPN